MRAPDPLAICDRLVELVGDRGEAEATVSVGRSALTRFANSAIHQNLADDHWHARLRVVCGGRSARVISNRLTPDALERMVDGALTAASMRAPDPDWPGTAPPAPISRGVDHYAESAHFAPPAARASVVAAFIDAGRAAVGAGGGAAGGPREVLTAAGFCSTGGSETAFANSAGQRLSARSSRAVVEGIQRTSVADGKGYEIGHGAEPLDGARAGAVAAQKAMAAGNLVDVEPGDWEVVLEPPCVSDIVDFLGEGFNAKTHAEGRSFVRLGEGQLDEAVTIFDDATDPRALGLPFDAEGTPRRRLDLVVDGVCRNVVHDRRTAAVAGVQSTGHGVPGGESAGALPGHLFLVPGARPAVDPADLIASVERGLLVTDFWYTRILDPKTQVVTGLTRNGLFLIERGEVVGGVRNLRFTESYSDALRPGNVAGVGSDGRLAGEDQHFVPTLHLRRWSFTGGARG